MNGFENENQIIKTISSLHFNEFSSGLKNILLKINGGSITKT